MVHMRQHFNMEFLGNKQKKIEAGKLQTDTQYIARIIKDFLGMKTDKLGQVHV